MCILPNSSEYTSAKREKIVFESNLDRDSRFHNLRSRLLKTYRPTRISTTDKLYDNGVRASFNEFGELVQCIQKVRVGKGNSSVDIYCPSSSLSALGAASIRISVKQEKEVSSDFLQFNPLPVYERFKQRLSFEIGLWSVDLTEVETRQEGCDPTKTYEVEVEILNRFSRHLGEAVTAPSSPNGNLFLKVMESLLSTIRCLEEFSRRV